MGDMNIAELVNEFSELNPQYKNMCALLESQGLQDACRVISPLEIDEWGFLTEPASELFITRDRTANTLDRYFPHDPLQPGDILERNRLDYVFSRGLSPLKAEVLSSESKIVQVRNRVIELSDHYPLRLVLSKNNTY